MNGHIDYRRMRVAVCWGVVSGLLWFWLILFVIAFIVGFATGAFGHLDWSWLKP